MPYIQIIVRCTLFSFFYGFEMQGLATADLMHGNREMSLRFVADRTLELAKQGISLRSEIILNVAHFPCHV
jgi:hypothetical protein